jgi:di/tricarboxylate transporter
MLITLLVLALVIFLFIKEVIPPDSVVLLALIVLVITGVLSPSEAFSGFGSDFIVTLAAIFMVSSVIQENGVVDYLVSRLEKLPIGNFKTLVAVTMAPVALLSGFMSNTSVAAVSVLPVKRLSEKLEIAPSKTLMPIAFASILGGMLTLIGTSTNIVGNTFMILKGMQGLGMFEFLPIGLVLVVVAIFYFVFFGDKLLPSRLDSRDEKTGEKQYYASFFINNNSPLLNITLAKVYNLDCTRAYVIKTYGSQSIHPNTVLSIGDVLYIEADSATLKTFYTYFSLKENEEEISRGQLHFAELLILPNSNLIGSSLRQSRFFSTTGLYVIAVDQRLSMQNKSMMDIHLSVGDVLLVAGSQSDISQISLGYNFLTLTKQAVSEHPQLKRGFIALGLFIGAVVLATVKVLPISMAFLSVVMLIAAFNIAPTKKLFESVDWRLLILIGGMAAFGVAITKTGTDVVIAHLITENLSFLPEFAILSILMLITVLLTQPMSNAASALIMMPIAYEVAQKLQVEPRGFIIAIILSASVSMITPFEPASAIVYRPGNYTVKDFLRIGGVLTSVSLLVIVIAIKVMYL